MNHPLRAVAALSALSLLAAPAEEITYAPKEGVVLTRTFHSEGSYGLDSASLEVDGQEIDHPPLPDVQIESSEDIAVTDEILSVADGRPLALSRTFDELGRTVRITTPDDEEERVSVCDLEGSTVRFDWDEDEGEYVASSDEDLDGDVLSDLVEDMDLRQLLPEGEVEPGDEWDVDVEAYGRLMYPGGFLHMYDEGEEYEEDPTDREMVDNLLGECHVVFEEVREEEGGRVAVLSVSFDLSSSASRPVEGPQDTEATETTEISRELEGTVRWSLDAGRLLGADLAGDSSLEQRRSGTAEGPEGEVEYLQVQSFSGTMSYSITVEEG